MAKKEAESQQDIAAMSFEEAMGALDEIVSQLERAQVPLEQSIALYTRGVALKAHCEARLKAAQMQVDKITLNDKGQVAGVSDFAAD